MASSVEDFFAKTAIPSNLDAILQSVNSFVKRCQVENLKVAFISSGGTTVPLESKTVRYIDNFSIGTRGASSAEYFLQNGYAVLFLHRKGSLEPFKRHFTNMNFLDLLESDSNNDNLKVKNDQLPKVKKIFDQYKEIQRKGLLLQVEFTTLHDYLHLLRGLTLELNSHGKDVLFYLAAAVSDFFIPLHDMPEHKIQSSEGPLNLTLHLVPKILQPLVAEWAPNAFTVSFKLETDSALLIPKSRAALEKYNHQLVIANLLETRKQEVIIVTRDDSKPIRLTQDQLANGVEIEEFIIAELKSRHSEFRET